MKANWVKKGFVAALLLFGAGQVFAAELNHGQAGELCKSRIGETQLDQSNFKYRRMAAKSYRRGVYTFMFNYSASTDGEIVSRKVKCAVSKAGEVKTLDIEKGSWSF